MASFLRRGGVLSYVLGPYEVDFLPQTQEIRTELKRLVDYPGNYSPDGYKNLVMLSFQNQAIQEIPRQGFDNYHDYVSGTGLITFDLGENAHYVNEEGLIPIFYIDFYWLTQNSVPIAKFKDQGQDIPYDQSTGSIPFSINSCTLVKVN